MTRVCDLTDIAYYNKLGVRDVQIFTASALRAQSVSVALGLVEIGLVQAVTTESDRLVVRPYTSLMMVARLDMTSGMDGSTAPT